VPRKSLPSILVISTNRSVANQFERALAGQARVTAIHKPIALATLASRDFGGVDAIMIPVFSIDTAQESYSARKQAELRQRSSHLPPRRGRSKQNENETPRIRSNHKSLALALLERIESDASHLSLVGVGRRNEWDGVEGMSICKTPAKAVRAVLKQIAKQREKAEEEAA
jgi:hypothetical protein